MQFQKRIITSAWIVIDKCPQKADPHHVCITLGGNLIDYKLRPTLPKASIVDDLGIKYIGEEHIDHLITTLERYHCQQELEW